ncbi:hypothetical protein Bbelb_375600 [Branchiostoma belcheri]|nr:hypothetical protein Bbelb_375600 [Branchiostoma belcheri]
MTSRHCREKGKARKYDVTDSPTPLVPSNETGSLVHTCKGVWWRRGIRRSYVYGHVNAEICFLDFVMHGNVVTYTILPNPLYSVPSGMSVDPFDEKFEITSQSVARCAALGFGMCYYESPGCIVTSDNSVVQKQRTKQTHNTVQSGTFAYRNSAQNNTPQLDSTNSSDASKMFLLFIVALVVWPASAQEYNTGYSVTPFRGSARPTAAGRSDSREGWD